MTRQEMLDMRMEALMQKALYLRDYTKAAAERGDKFLAEFDEMLKQEKEKQENQTQQQTKS